MIQSIEDMCFDTNISGEKIHKIYNKNIYYLKEYVKTKICF